MKEFQLRAGFGVMDITIDLDGQTSYVVAKIYNAMNPSVAFLGWGTTDVLSSSPDYTQKICDLLKTLVGEVKGTDSAMQVVKRDLLDYFDKEAQYFTEDFFRPSDIPESVVAVSQLGFTYQELASVTALVKNIERQSEPGTVVDSSEQNIQEMTAHYRKLYGEIADESFNRAFSFYNKTRDKYKTLTPVEQILKQVLNEPCWFPENLSLFNRVTGSEYLAVAYNELQAFWRAYSYHYNIALTLISLGNLITPTLIEWERPETETPCLFHRGQSDVLPLVQQIVQYYDDAEAVLGFSPALPCWKEPSTAGRENSGQAVLLLRFSGELKVIQKSAFLATQAGMIWFVKPTFDSIPGQPTLSIVK